MRKTWMILATAMLALALGAPVGSAHGGGRCGRPTFSDPLDIDNTYHPFVEFRIRLYELVKGEDELFVIDVFRPQTRTFLLKDGTEVECAVLEEWEIEDGEVVEISENYFAQSDKGTVWYFGEVVDIYEDGEVVGHDGSWLVGGPTGDDPEETATATKPTIFMPACPRVGDVWKPEDLPEAGIEEFVKVLRYVRRVRVPAGRYCRVLKVREKTPDIETKWYARHVGFLKAKDGAEVLALTELIDNEDEDEMLEELDAILEDLLDEEE
ncbi:MAG: hypothetical protein ACYS0K_11085 [Planctomycetota bacterium]|jgi:hypothetical protein